MIASTPYGWVMLELLDLLKFWTWGPRRPDEPGFAYVYVNQDGSVRELSPAEQAYVSTEFQFGDGARPYIKGSYESRDGWGSRSGFLLRRRVPKRLVIAAVNPDFDTAVKTLQYDRLGFARAAGDVIRTNADGSITVSRDPAVANRLRFERSRSHMLEEQRRREELARIPRPTVSGSELG
jgi:hypothetical protein